MRQLSALDLAFLALESPRTPMHVGSLGLYQSPSVGPALDRAAVVDHIAARLHLSPTFRQRVVPAPFGLDRPYWAEDPAFDLGAHVRHRRLPAPGDRRALWSEAARIVAQPLDLTRPPWELWVIDGLDPSTGADFALLAKVHHAAVDGVSGMEILAAIHDRRPEPGVVPPAAARGEAGPSDLEVLARTATNLFSAPMRFGQFVQEAMAVQRDRPRPREGSSGGAPRTVFNGLVTADRVLRAWTVPSAELRPIQPLAPGATANDVVLSIVGGALRRYLEAEGGPPDRSLVAMVPVSVRSRDRREGGNRVTAMLVRLGTDVADPVERLRAVSARTRRSKGRARGGEARRLLDLLEITPVAPAALASAPTLFAASGRDPLVNGVVTSVPLGRRPIYLAGARLLEVHGTAPVVDGVGLMHVVVTYAGTTSIGVTACPTALVEPDRYVDALDEAYEELRRAAG